MPGVGRPSTQDARRDATEDVGDAAVDQDGTRIVRALPATVPSQNPVSGATTTGGLATVTFRDQP